MFRIWDLIIKYVTIEHENVGKTKFLSKNKLQ